MSGIRVTTLPNGVRVVSDVMPTVESVSIGIWVKAGARFEPLEVNGVAHLLEHMMFKGTALRSAQQIAETIESVGGHINAYTAREVTAYYAKVLKDDAALALDVIADFLQNSLFDEDELGRERSVVLQEIGQALDTPDARRMLDTQVQRLVSATVLDEQVQADTAVGVDAALRSALIPSWFRGRKKDSMTMSEPVISE